MSWPFSRNLVKGEPLFMVSKNQEKFALSDEPIISRVPCVNLEIIFGGAKTKTLGAKMFKIEDFFKRNFRDIIGPPNSFREILAQILSFNYL